MKASSFEHVNVINRYQEKKTLKPSKDKRCMCAHLNHTGKSLWFKQSGAA